MLLTTFHANRQMSRRSCSAGRSFGSESSSWPRMKIIGRLIKPPSSQRIISPDGAKERGKGGKGEGEEEEKEKEKRERMNLFEFLKGSNIDYDWVKLMLTRDWMLIARLEKAWRSVHVFHFSDSVRMSRFADRSRFALVANCASLVRTFFFLFSILFLSLENLKMDAQNGRL